MAQFFDYPLNYGPGRSQYREVADNDYNTFTPQTSFLLNIDTAGDGSGEAREFTDIFVKVRGIASYAAAFTNPENITSPAAHTLPPTVKNDSRDEVSTIVDGYQHDLYSLWTDENTSKPQAKSITLTFTGSNVRIYEVMVLDRLLTLNLRNLRPEYDSIDLGIVDPDLRGRLSYVPPIGGERDKWRVRYTLESLREAAARDQIADRLIHFIRRYKNFVLAAEYNRYPDRVFPALWPNPETQIRYIGGWKGAGRRVRFTVREA